MYYRRKLILAVLQTFEGKLSKLDFQKLLFLFTQKQMKPSYDFMPYRFGCYSPQANQDLKTMIKYNLVKEDGNDWIMTDSLNYKLTLNKKDREDLELFAGEYKSLRGRPLIEYVYEKYPFYAIKSEIVESVLNSDKIKKVKSLLPSKNDPVLFTIGYEGKSIEKYVTELIKEDIKLLCDIRKNPLSMKFGFSKNQLKGILEGVGIEYVHIPGLGIDSDKRQELNTPSDYEQLFSEYEKTTLIQNTTDLQALAKLFQKAKRIALTLKAITTLVTVAEQLTHYK